MWNSRMVAGMLLCALVSVLVPRMNAVTLQPTDGMSAAAMFFAKLDAFHAKNMRSEEAKAAPSVPGSGPKGKPPPPPSSTDAVPCFLGGDDCKDYESNFDPCTIFTCNLDERRCVPSPRKTGTPCGEDDDYYFGTCNEGPGFCKTVESEFGDFGICVGIPKFGAPCNDYDTCTKNDRCKIVRTSDGVFRGQCMGKFDATLPCTDYNDECTINDKCTLLTTDEGNLPVCRGELVSGGTCNDYNDCSTNDQCISVPPRFIFDDGIRCRGTVDSTKTCNDYNECTDNDVCTEIPSDYGDLGSFIGCRGQLIEGRSCVDYNDCTENDVCQLNKKGTFAICKGTLASGATCDDYNECTSEDACVLDPEGDYAFCEGKPTVGAVCDDNDDCSDGDVCQQKSGSNDYGDYSFTFCQGKPRVGGTCDDRNPCTTGDTCVAGRGFTFCQGKPAAGAACNDYNQCTDGDTCVLGTSGDYSFCQSGEPTPGAACDDYRPETSGDVCVTEEYGTFCQGEGAPGPV